jgi:CHASE3 domain sensor protein
MTEQQRSVLGKIALTFLVPVLTLFVALGVAKVQLAGKEDSGAHALDIQRVNSNITEAVQRLESRDDEQRVLLLDVLCAVKEADRRCR